MSRAVNRIIREKLGRFASEEPRSIHPRTLDLGDPLPPAKGNPITAIAGVRRCGKTHRLYQEMGRLRDEGVSPGRICYFDFGDERLEEVSPQTGDRVLATFRSLHPETSGKGVYLFLDGIDAMDGWDSWVFSIAAQRRATIYVSGSLPMRGLRHLADSRGRDLRVEELYPYSFAEYRRIALRDDRLLPEVEPVDNEMRFAHRDPLTRYLSGGGFPEVVDLPDEPRTDLLQDLATSVVLRDVVLRGDLPQPRLVRRLAHRMLVANGQPLSLRKVAKAFRQSGLAASEESLRDRVDELLDAHLAYRIPYCDVESREFEGAFRKVYAVDPGLARACARVHANNISFLLENAVYLELLRRTAGSDGQRVHCLRDPATGHEVDFLTGDPLGDGPSALYQVTWDIGPEKVLSREVRSMLETFDEIARLRGDGGRSLPQATIIVGSSSEEDLARARSRIDDLGEQGRRISLVSAETWFLGEGDATRTSTS